MDKHPDGLHLQVAAMQQLRHRLHGDLGRHRADLRPGRRRRRPHDPVEETATNEGGSGSFTSSATARCNRTPHRHTRTGNHRHRPAGQDPDRGPRHMGKQPDRLHVQVAAVRQRGQQLRPDLRRHRADLRARGRGRRPHDQGRTNPPATKAARPAATSGPSAVVKPEAPRKTPIRRKSRGAPCRARRSQRSTAAGKTARPASPTSGSSATTRAATAPRSQAPPRRPTCPWPGTSATRSGSKRPPATKVALRLLPAPLRLQSCCSHPPPSARRPSALPRTSSRPTTSGSTVIRCRPPERSASSASTSRQRRPWGSR